MPNSTSASCPRPPQLRGPHPVSDDRRSRQRLRGLCDEVLASFRIATGDDPFSDADRREARELLAGMALVPRG